MRGTILLAILGGLASAAAAQPQNAPLQVAERAALSASVLANPEIRRITGGTAARTYFGDATYDKGEVEAYLDGRTDQPPPARVAVVVVSPGGAARATLSTATRRILSIEAIPANEVPLFDEDVAQALDLVRGDNGMRAMMDTSLRQFQPARAGQEYPRDAYVAEALPTRSASADDPCGRDRCLEFVFRTPRGYLPFRALVDLTRRTVTPITSDGSHHQ